MSLNCFCRMCLKRCLTCFPLFPLNTLIYLVTGNCHDLVFHFSFIVCFEIFLKDTSIQFHSLNINKSFCSFHEVFWLLMADIRLVGAGKVRIKIDRWKSECHWSSSSNCPPSPQTPEYLVCCLHFFWEKSKAFWIEDIYDVTSFMLLVL